MEITQAFKDCGRFRLFKRTEGVSTTDIIGRLLMATSNPGQGKVLGGKANAITSKQYIKELNKPKEGEESQPGENQPPSIAVNQSNFLTTSRRIMQFSN